MNRLDRSWAAMVVLAVVSALMLIAVRNAYLAN
jgi:competence protein ComGC